ncbi:MAG: succinate dehydrogenase/fumarate reductase iron-sulfur subunit [Litorivicinaceae bacterium]
MKTKDQTLTVTIDRFDGTSHYQTTHDVPTRDNQTVLDVVTWIQQHDDPTLSYRFACRVGMCGSCAMNINGEPKWSCRTHASKVVDAGSALRISPLRNMPILRDLSVDMTPFFDKWTQAVGYFVPTQTKDDPLPAIKSDDRDRAKANQSIECINCGICYSACDVVAANDAYLGPAALNRAWTLVNDERDGGAKERLEAVSSDAGCHNCHSQHGCSTYCPNLLAPATSIAGLKRQTLLNLLPWGSHDD